MQMHRTPTTRMVAITKATMATMMTTMTISTTIRELLDSIKPKDNARVVAATILKKTLRHLATSQ